MSDEYDIDGLEPSAMSLPAEGKEELTTQVVADEEEEEEVDETAAGDQDDHTRPWCRIHFLDEQRTPQELFRKDPEQQDGTKFNVYTIGRAETADLRFEHARISKMHAKLYCKRRADFSDERVDVFIEDSSTNGTFINGADRLPKRIPRMLRGSEEISLVNPAPGKKQDAPTEIEKKQNAFVVQLLLNHVTREQARKRTTQRVVTEAQVNEVVASLLLSRTSTLVRMLQSRRAFVDFYDLGELKGQGTCGSVYEAFCKTTGTPSAVKIISLKKGMFSTSSEAIEDLVNEADMIRSLQHENMIQLKDIFCDVNNLYIVMELVEGGDLFDRIVRKRFYEEHLAKQLFHKLLRVVAYLHANNVVHRDLKPENILLISQTSDVDVKTLDLRNEQEGMGSRLFAYIAPEVLARRDTPDQRARYDEAVDVWSLGVILYVLLCGSMPFKESTLEDDIRNARLTTQGRWVKISDEGKDLIYKMLTTDPARRVTCAEALRHTWFNDLTGDNSATKETELKSQDSMPPPSVAMDVQERDTDETKRVRGIQEVEETNGRSKRPRK